MKDIKLLKHSLWSSWTEETSYCPNNWDKNNRAIGQCAITSLFLYNKYGGKIIRGYSSNLKETHYWNLLPDGKKIDLTFSQFENDVFFEKEEVVNPNKFISDNDFARRYSELNSNLLNFNRKYNQLNKKITECSRCNDVESFEHHPLYLGKECRILIIGEAPAKNGWKITGKAWINQNNKIIPTGVVLNKLLKIINIDLFDISYTEAIKCYPKDRKNIPTNSSNCLEYLLEQIDLLKPGLILTMGEAATKNVLSLDKKVKMKEIVGRKYKIKINRKDYDVFPIYHTSPISPKSYSGNIPIFNKIKEVMLK